MARPAGLNCWPWLAVVLLLHAAALEWLARAGEQRALLRPLGPVLYTRLLAPQQPAPVPAAPGAAASVEPPLPPGVIALRPRAAASAPKVAKAMTPAPKKVDPPGPEPVVPQPAEPVKESPAGEAVLEASAADALGGEDARALADPGLQAPEAVDRDLEAPPVAGGTRNAGDAHESTSADPVAADTAAAAAPAAAWPPDTRLNYRVGGMFRSGPLYGSAKVLWQRQAGRYQVLVDIDITLWARMLLASEGELGPDGLRPSAYEEVRPGRKRRALRFAADSVTLDNGASAPRPPGLQDTASQFVELAQRFASGREPLEVGRSIAFWLGRPGGVDLWTYDVVEKETLQTPALGPVQAWRLKPRPIGKPRGKITAEMWFAPSLQYLPVRIKVFTGDEAYLDLMVETIEQR